jgi:hypothetical protein
MGKRKHRLSTCRQRRHGNSRTPNGSARMLQCSTVVPVFGNKRINQDLAWITFPTDNLDGETALPAPTVFKLSILVERMLPGGQ